jgi:hypothetical protein
VIVPDCASRDPGGHPRLGQQVASGRHPARERSSARIGLRSPGRRCLLRATTGDQHTPQTADRKFGADSMGGGDLSSGEVY